MSLLSRLKKTIGQTETKPHKPKQSVEKTVPKQATVEAMLARTIDLTVMLTEKSLRNQERNTVVFRVRPFASKIHIFAAIKEQYGVQARSIRTAHVRPKLRRRGQTGGLTPEWKKAYVKVDDVSKFTSIEE